MRPLEMFTFKSNFYNIDYQALTTEFGLKACGEE